MNKLYLILIFSISILNSNAQRISLKGKWSVQLGSDSSKTYLINLPGVLDDAGIGEPVKIKPSLTIAVLDHLQRKVQYVGKAYYSRKFIIPSGWKNKDITLKLERVLWESTVMIDGKMVETSRESLVASHIFNITDYIIPGKEQELTICVNNSNIYPGINIYATQYPSVESSAMAHSYTNHTQIKWNGILGDILLVAKPKISLDKIDVITDLQNKKLNIQYELNTVKAENITIHSFVKDRTTGKKWPSIFHKSPITEKEIVAAIPFSNDITYWSEFSPKMYQLVTTVQSNLGTDTIITPFGIRDLKTKEGNLYLNNNRIFIRGNLECVIFPLKGYPPMKINEWLTLFKTAKRYGLNTFRFHSWCPPDAAFAAADKIGFYL